MTTYFLLTRLCKLYMHRQSISKTSQIQSCPVKSGRHKGAFLQKCEYSICLEIKLCFAKTRGRRHWHWHVPVLKGLTYHIRPDRHWHENDFKFYCSHVQKYSEWAPCEISSRYGECISSLDIVTNFHLESCRSKLSLNPFFTDSQYTDTDCISAR